jgi:hypothetical protein
MLLDTSRESGLEGNTEKSEYVIVSRHQNVGQSHNIVNKYFENVAKFKYLGTTVTNQVSFTKKLRAD